MFYSYFPQTIKSYLRKVVFSAESCKWMDCFFFFCISYQYLCFFFLMVFFHISIFQFLFYCLLLFLFSIVILLSIRFFRFCFLIDISLPFPLFALDCLLFFCSHKKRQNPLLLCLFNALLYLFSVLL